MYALNRELLAVYTLSAIAVGRLMSEPDLTPEEAFKTMKSKGVNVEMLTSAAMLGTARLMEEYDYAKSE